jgi:hypothetical protein
LDGVPSDRRKSDKAVGKPVGGMNLLGLIMPTYTWADVMAAFRTSPKVVRLPGIAEPKTSDMKIEHFANGVAPIHGVQPKRKKGGEEQAAAAPGKRASITIDSIHSTSRMALSFCRVLAVVLIDVDS